MAWTEDEYNAYQRRQRKAKEAPIEAGPQVPKAKTRIVPSHSVGVMNNTEKKYAAILEARILVGEVASYKFESINFRLGVNLHYRPDFYVVMADRTIEIHEVKGGGGWKDDARVKIKVLATQYPELLVRSAMLTNSNEWKFEIFNPY